MRKQSVVALAGAGVAALASVALLAAPASAQPLPSHAAAHGAEHRADTGSAVFVQSNNPAGNTVVAYARSADGSLSQRGVYATGGKGGREDGTGPDPLASQGSLTYDKAHQRLYTVNAGSDTLTVFSVHGDKLVREQTVSTGGSLPVSVTAHGGAVYVLNALHGGSVQGYLTVGNHLLRVPAWHRDLHLDADVTPGQVAFTPDGSQLVVAAKSAGFLTFRVGLLGGLAARPVVSTSSSVVPFATTFDAAGRVVTADAGINGLATFSVGRDSRLTKVDEQPTGQAATCWVVRDGNLYFTGNAGGGSVSAFREDGRGHVTSLGSTATGAGTIDLAVSSDGRYLYAQIGSTSTVKEFRVHEDGSLTQVGTVTVPGAAGAEGIVAS